MRIHVSLHTHLDRALARLASPLGKLYAHGFGDDLDARVGGVRDYVGPSATADLRWGRSRRVLGVTVRAGHFLSPAAPYLPPESRDGIVEAWMPRPDAPVCLVLAATAEESFGRRRPFARWLATHGVGAVLLENPFYGARRPAGQRGPYLRTVADQFAMNLATVEEAATLLRTFHEEGHVVGVTGYSQGGVMAAFAAAVSDFSLAVVPRGAARAAAPVFTESALSQAIHWEALAREAGGLEAARSRFLASLEPVRVDRYPPPRDPKRAIVVASRDDGFIPAAEAEALHRHWQGAELRWTEGGHLTGLVLHHDVHRRAILDAFGRTPTGARAGS